MFSLQFWGRTYDFTSPLNKDRMSDPKIVKKDSCEESRPKLATKVFSYISNARTHYARARCISS